MRFQSGSAGGNAGVPGVGGGAHDVDKTDKEDIGEDTRAWSGEDTRVWGGSDGDRSHGDISTATEA